MSGRDDYLNEIEDLQYSLDCIKVWQHIHEARMPEGTDGRIARLHEWGATPGNFEKFAKMVKDAQDAVRKAKMGLNTDEMIERENKSVGELQDKLRDMRELFDVTK